ncbi:MAG: ABC transporter permease [Betaproteobacteria bacterium]|nr:ABC transporter permease [Betaproteobacteria bacterium]
MAQSSSLGRRLARAATDAAFWRGLLGLTLFFLAWYVLTAVLKLPRFEKIPDPLAVLVDWLNPHATRSLFTAPYYVDILYSVARTYVAFLAAVVFGVGLGLFMGWSTLLFNFTFPLVEVFRPIPPLSWIPLAIIVLPGIELPVVYVTFIAAFFATVINTILGVHSIDRKYFLAARCLGARPLDVLRDVVVPGALPFIFTGLQIAMGLAWMSLVAGEIIAGQRGLGYYIYQAASLYQYDQVVMYMFTLGFLGFVSSVLIRRVGQRMMAWEEARRKSKG